MQNNIEKHNMAGPQKQPESQSKEIDATPPRLSSLILKLEEAEQTLARVLREAFWCRRRKIRSPILR